MMRCILSAGQVAQTGTRRETDAVQFLRLAKDENQMRVDNIMGDYMNAPRRFPRTGKACLRPILFVLGLALGASLALAQTRTDQIEPRAGTWKTWVLSSGSELRVPPPAQSGG